ncbi:hypothetical protein AB0P13_23575 [Rhodococcus pyridinivorans]|uniref:hypothetical protein n=1 Tax=Rhodococcus pyridinivorans TaxID=103816 RepID=UPI00341F627B
MTSYGFRLFTLEMKKNGRGAWPKMLIENNDEQEHVRDYLTGLLTKRRGIAVHGNPPKVSGEPDEPDDPAEEDEEGEQGDGTVPGSARRPRPVLAIMKVHKRGDHLIIDFRYGSRSSYTHAGYSESQTDVGNPVDISELKAVRLYRAAFILPENGEIGVLAVEDINRTCPRLALERWIRYWARCDAREAEAKIVEDGGKKKKLDWWSVKGTPLNDPEHLNSIMKNGKSTKIVLTKVGASNSRTPGTSELKIQMGIGNDPGVAAQTRQTITSWFSGPSVPTGSADQKQASRDLAAIIADRYAGFDGEDYDDAWVDVEDESGGGVRHISPSRWADVFTYRVHQGESAPLDSVLYRAVKVPIERVKKSLQVEIDWSGW